jgi:hypothetical protein
LLIRITLTSVLVATAACGESREEAARRIGQVDIEPRKTLGTLRKSIAASPEVRDSSVHKARALVKLAYGPKGGGEPLVELWFHSASSDVAAAARPIAVIARRPFGGSILGVRPGDSRETAVRALLKRQTRVFSMDYYQPGMKPPPPAPGGWTIPLEGAYLTWTPGASGDGGELRFGDRSYSIHEGTGVSVHLASRRDPPMPDGIGPGSFPFVLHPHIALGSEWRLLADGKVVAASGKNPGAIREIVVVTSSEDGPVLAAKVLLPCGWRETPVTEGSRTMPRLGADGKFAGQGSVTFGVTASLPLNSFIVDNRGRPESILKQGEVAQPVAADGKMAFRLPAPDCESAGNLELDGQAIAKLPMVAADQKDATGAHYLVDPTGRRCYQFRTVMYGIAINRHAAGEPVRLVAQRLHRLPAGVDHVFEKPSDRVKVYGGTSSATKTQLTEISCL